MVGAAPSINVVSVRASRDGVTFGATDLAAGIQQCLTYRNDYNIKVISLSLGGIIVSGLDAGLMALAEDMVRNARRAGINVVAAAGNHPGAVDWPAAFEPVLAVGAAMADGDRCAFAASGPEVDLWALGCPIDAALFDGTPVWAAGSSESTAFVAGVLTELRQLTPGWTVEQAEWALTSSAQAVTAGRRLDVGAAFVAAGMADQLVIGHAKVPRLTSTSDASVPKPLAPAGAPLGQADTATSTSEATTRAIASRFSRRPIRSRLHRPSVSSLRLRQHVLSMSFKNKARGMEAQIRIYARTKRRTFPSLSRTFTVVDDRFRTRVSGSVSQVSITYRDPHKIKRPSVVLLLHLPISARVR